MQPAGWSKQLPSGRHCAGLVHRSPWEPRPENYDENHATQKAAAIDASFATRPRSPLNTYDPKWDSWLLPRVGGQFSGTTDEIFQWASCKWGLPDNLIRAVAVRESLWYQGLHWPDGSCYVSRGCGDFFSNPSPASMVYCDALAKYGHDYQREYGQGMCPKTFSILGIMSYWAPDWGFDWADNQNGTFPFQRNSTAFAADYYASQIRGCYNGWEWQLGREYHAGDLWGCVGAWYSGLWHDSAGDAYAARVREELSNRTWLKEEFANWHYSCDIDYGCPK